MLHFDLITKKRNQVVKDNIWYQWLRTSKKFYPSPISKKNKSSKKRNACLNISEFLQQFYPFPDWNITPGKKREVFSFVNATLFLGWKMIDYLCLDSSTFDFQYMIYILNASERVSQLLSPAWIIQLIADKIIIFLMSCVTCANIWLTRCQNNITWIITWSKCWVAFPKASMIKA